MSRRTDQKLGKMKHAVGELTHNRALKRRGRFEVARGRAKGLFGSVRKSVRRMR